MRKIKFLGLLFTGMLACASCKKLLDVHSTHAVDEANSWNSHNDTRSALIGVYGLMRAAVANDDAYWMYGDVRGGDFTAVSRADLQSIIDNKLNAPYPLLSDLSNWRRFYAVINAANMFLEHVGEVKARDPKYSDQNMEVDVAQVRLLRALSYFYLVRIWGDVPLITVSHDGEFKPKGRDSQQKVLAFCEQELQEAANDLPYGYSSDDPQQQGDYYNRSASQWNGALARKLSAYAILAHVAAWQGKYADVATYTGFIMDNYSKEGHSFLTADELCNSDGFFSGKRPGPNPNHILAFDFLYDNNEASFTGHLEELTLAEPLIDKQMPDIYIPKDSILSIFNLPNDQRFSLDTLTGQPTSERYFSNFNSKIPVFSKIKVIRDGGSSNPEFRIFGSSIVFTRLEEIALLRAEALTVIGDPNNAIILLNQIRDERGLEHYNQAADGDLLTAIFHERRKELMGEGWRWYDRIRYNRIKQNNPAFMQLITSGGIYWPVSEDILAQNKLITQNPYWK
jgi:hypothetical protein